MADYPYCTVPGKLSEFLTKIHSMGIPDKVTTRWLPSVGFGSTNDRSIIPALKFVGLIDTSGVPTEVWRQFRGHSSRRALAAAIKSAYSELFKTYPDANNRPIEELRAFIRGHSNYGAQAVAKAVNTFQALCSSADFDTNQELEPSGKVVSEHKKLSAAVDTPPIPAQTVHNSPSLHVDIQIHISPEASPEQIEKIFESMSKHLYKNI